MGSVLAWLRGEDPQPPQPARQQQAGPGQLDPPGQQPAQPNGAAAAPPPGEQEQAPEARVAEQRRDELLASTPSSYYCYLTKDDPALEAKIPSVSNPQAQQLLQEVEEKYKELVSLRLKVDESSKSLRHALCLQEGATLPSCIKEWVDRAFEGDCGTPARNKLDIRYDDQNRVTSISVNRRAEELADDVRQAGECVEQILCDCHVFLQEASLSQDRMMGLCQQVLNLPSRQMATQDAATRAKNMCKNVEEFKQQCDSLLKNFLASVPFLNRTAQVFISL